MTHFLDQLLTLLVKSENERYKTVEMIFAFLFKLHLHEVPLMTLPENRPPKQTINQQQQQKKPHTKQTNKQNKQKTKHENKQTKNHHINKQQQQTNTTTNNKKSLATQFWLI